MPALSRSISTSASAGPRPPFHTATLPTDLFPSHRFFTVLRLSHESVIDQATKESATPAFSSLLRSPSLFEPAAKLRFQARLTSNEHELHRRRSNWLNNRSLVPDGARRFLITRHPYATLVPGRCIFDEQEQVAWKLLERLGGSSCPRESSSSRRFFAIILFNRCIIQSRKICSSSGMSEETLYENGLSLVSVLPYRDSLFHEFPAW